MAVVNLPGAMPPSPVGSSQGNAGTWNWPLYTDQTQDQPKLLTASRRKPTMPALPSDPLTGGPGAPISGDNWYPQFKAWLQSQGFGQQPVAPPARPVTPTPASAYPPGTPNAPPNLGYYPPNLGYYPPNPRFTTVQYNTGGGRGPNAPIYTALNLARGGPGAPATAAPAAPAPQASPFPSTDDLYPAAAAARGGPPTQNVPTATQMQAMSNMPNPSAIDPTGQWGPRSVPPQQISQLFPWLALQTGGQYG